MTTFQQSIADDITLVCDGLETVSIYLDRQLPETVTVQNVNQSMLTKRNNQFSNVNIEEGDLQFAFNINQFVPENNDATIQQRDLITDADGNVYIVQSSNLAVIGTVLQVQCRLKG